IRVLARAGEQALAADHDGARVADRGAILRRAALDRDRVTDLHRVARPALAHEAVRAAHFEAPVLNLGLVGGLALPLRLLTLGSRRSLADLGDVHVEIRVRIQPLDLGDVPSQLDALLSIELCRE